ncbi:MAG: hypothetical protein LBR67_09260 [Dysgonamonadaceae bacterium]|jgi:hypothetical protein|nr:hypothetical protein [Dysgonamonadaceae bacterium]
MLQTEQNRDHTDVDMIAPNDSDNLDFVTIDDTFADLSEAVMIDMSDDEFIDSFTVEATIDSDSFVTFDDDIIVSGFTDDDFNATIVDVDLIHEKLLYI